MSTDTEKASAMVHAMTAALNKNKELHRELAATQKEIERLKLVELSLIGNLGHPVPSGVKLPEVQENVLASFIAKERDQLRELLHECERVTELCLANFACDWYVEMMSKDTTPNGMSTGIAAQVHNRDVAKRFMIALEEQRDLLQKLRKEVSDG